MKEVVSFSGLKVFSATKAKERDLLGEHITEWIKINPHLAIVDKVITQSSDNEYHCLAITLFYSGDPALNKEVPNGNQQGSHHRPNQGRSNMASASERVGTTRQG